MRIRGRWTCWLTGRHLWERFGPRYAMTLPEVERCVRCPAVRYATGEPFDLERHYG